MNVSIVLRELTRAIVSAKFSIETSKTTNRVKTKALEFMRIQGMIDAFFIANILSADEATTATKHVRKELRIRRGDLL